MKPHHRRAIAVVLLLASICLPAHISLAEQESGEARLDLSHVLASVERQYPPLLMAMIERDITGGRLQSAHGVFDLGLFAKLYANPAGYYQYGTLDVGVEQFTGLWGSTIFGGYRLNRGDELPTYYSNRTQEGGEPRVGLNVPLLRDGSIDRRRANLRKAEIDRDLADPFIARQRLEVIRAATVAYVSWVAAGQRWQLAESLLQLAKDRTDALNQQSQAGLVARIVLTDNERLVVAREIGVVQARRRFEAASLALSLFYRTDAGDPVLASRERLPSDFPKPDPVDRTQVAADIASALRRRPELQRLQLTLDKLQVDQKLARNQMQPNLDVGVTVSQDIGDKTYFDKSQFELQAGLEFKLPAQRREAQGRLAEVSAQIEQVSNDLRFARDRIRMEVEDTLSAVFAAQEQIQQTTRNVSLALELQSAEEERFRRGAVDLLALQIREQAAYDAQILGVDALAELARAIADYRVAIAAALSSSS